MKRFFSVRYLVLVIAGLAIAYHFHITRKRFVDGNTQLKTELSDLKGEWIELRLKEGAATYAKQELIKLNKEMDRLSDEAAQIRQSLSVEQLAIESLEKRKKALFFEYREQVRREAKGMRFDEVRTPQGKHYENIEIMKGGPDGVSFRHGAAGSASGRGMGLDELPREWAKRFMYTDEELGAERTGSANARGWTTNLESALALAKQNKKFVMAQFTGSDWCPPCIMMQKAVFSKSSFTRLVPKKFILVKIDVPRSNEAMSLKNSKVMKNYNVTGVPTILLFGDDGKEFSRFGASQYPTVEGFIDKLSEELKKKEGN
jgi:thiol-disulfide isomerase/thioredoxin/cell division protein FtsL